MSTIDVGMRLGDAIDPFQLANGFEAVIGYECQERSNHPFSHSYDAWDAVTVSFTGPGAGINQFQVNDNGHVGHPSPCEVSLARGLVLVLVLHRGAVTSS